MSVIPITVFFSLLLVLCFVALFVREQGRRHLGGAERDSLLPLADERPRPVGSPAAVACVCPTTGAVVPPAAPCAACFKYQLFSARPRGFFHLHASP